MTRVAQARTAGILALLTTPAGFATVTVGGLIVADDASATAGNVASHELMLRLAVAGDALSVLYIPYTLLLFLLFKPVSPAVSLLAAMFSLVGTAVGMVNVLFELAPVAVLSGGAGLAALTPAQLDALVLVFLKLHALLGDVGLVLFGAYNVLIGYLIFRSGFMPRILGLLLAFAGLCYEVNNFATFLAPDFAARLLPYILLPGLAEIAVALWLVVFGVNVRQLSASPA